MGLFTASLFRSLALGFALGAVAVAAVLGSGKDDLASGMVPAAVAAPAK